MIDKQSDFRGVWNTPAAREFREFLAEISHQGLNQEGVHYTCKESQHVFVIDVSDVFLLLDGDRRPFQSLYVTYYKGRDTEGMWLLGGDTLAPEPATDDDLQKIFDHYRSLQRSAAEGENRNTAQQ